MARTDAQKRARAKYEAKARRYVVTVYPSEADIKARLDERTIAEGYSTYIKRLICEDIARTEAKSEE